MGRIIAWWNVLKVWAKARGGNVFIENGIWIIIVVLAMILPIEALRNALVTAFGSITNNLNAIP
jgi:Flp pilus assembly pilin Flp